MQAGVSRLSYDEGVRGFRLFGNVISSAVLGFGGIFRRTNPGVHSLQRPSSLAVSISISLFIRQLQARCYPRTHRYRSIKVVDP